MFVEGKELKFLLSFLKDASNASIMARDQRETLEDSSRTSLQPYRERSGQLSMSVRLLALSGEVSGGGVESHINQGYGCGWVWSVHSSSEFGV